MTLSFLKSKIPFSLLIALGAVAVSSPAFAQSAPSGGSTGVTDPVTTVGTAVTQAESVISKLGGLSASALAIALIPLGTMLSLRFLNMILSRV